MHEKYWVDNPKPLWVWGILFLILFLQTFCIHAEMRAVLECGAALNRRKTDEFGT